MEKRGRGRPKIIDDPRRTRSIRLRESEREKIEAKHGKVQKWIEEKYREEFGEETNEVEVEFKTKKGEKLAKSNKDFEVSEDDF